MTIRAPSIKRLTKELNITTEQAKLVRLAIKTVGHNNLDLLAEKSFPKVYRWLRSCYHEPSCAEVRASMLDEAIDGYGVEAVFRTSEGEERSHATCPDDQLVGEYLNAGDPYVATLVRRAGGEWRIGCMADLVGG